MATSPATSDRPRPPRRFSLSLRNSLSVAPRLFVPRSKSNTAISTLAADVPLPPAPAAAAAAAAAAPGLAPAPVSTDGSPKARHTLKKERDAAVQQQKREEDWKEQREKEKELDSIIQLSHKLNSAGKLSRDDPTRVLSKGPANGPANGMDKHGRRNSVSGVVRREDDTRAVNASLRQTFSEDNIASLAPGQPQITISTFLSPAQKRSNTSYRPGLESEALGPTTNPKSRASSDGFVSRPHRSWTSPNVSRSPSPSSRTGSSRDDRSSKDEEGSTTTAASSISSATSPTTAPSSTKASDDSAASQQESRTDAPSLTRKSTSNSVTGRHPRRRMSIFRSSSSEQTAPPVPPMPSKPNKGSIRSSPSKAVPKMLKDELYEAYKLFDSDFQKFQSKSNMAKAGILRQSVLPFLRKFREWPPSNIPPEELEKRVKILHRWWTGLLAQLRSRNAQAISGADRPVYLEAISSIMSRYEWRTAPSSYAPLSQRRVSSPAKSESSASLSSTASSFSIQKSVQHNIKVLFTRTLYDTLAYTIEKMALRSAPSVMVAFGGKAIAYAFYFCPGVAEMLVHLWGIQPPTVRRIMPEFGVGRGTDLKGISDNILCEFPETLHGLGHTNLATTMRRLKKIVKPPVGIPIDWYGQWLSRWCGRESDLLFVFFKYYHVLMCEYLPPDASPATRLCAPGYVMVLAQMLTLVDNTIHRQPNLLAPTDTASTTFDDLLNASATLPLTAPNMSRDMADNKLVVLLRDVIVDSICTKACREQYVMSFVAMLRAAVQRTQLYNADACFHLMDLLEEIIPVLVDAQKQARVQYMDWDFWLGVTKMMLQSENNMTELRVISFIYTIWDILMVDEDRKREVCLNWLLDVPTWERFFCHWCPMVRAYYMRLACWRVGRYNGDATPVDIEIYTTFLYRLRTGYAHHLRLKEAADKHNAPRSSTAPCLPAPSRRLVILRNDVISTATGIILDGIVPTSVSFTSSPGFLRSSSSSSLASLAESAAKPDTPRASLESTRSADSTGSVKSRWGTLRSVLSFKSAAAAEEEPPPLSLPAAPSMDGFLPEPAATAAAARAPAAPQKLANFKFSLEWIDRPIIGSRERVLGPPRLPGPAQKFLASQQNVVFNPKDHAGLMPAEVRGAKHWTYVGRAMSEWLMVVIEYENFFERRKQEGCETDRDVETPSLGVDSMRRF